MIMLAPATKSIMPKISVRFLPEIFLDVYAPTWAPMIDPAARVRATGKSMGFDGKYTDNTDAVATAEIDVKIIVNMDVAVAN